MSDTTTESDVGSVETPLDEIMAGGTKSPATLDGDDVPAEFKGSLSDIYNEVQQLRNTHKINTEVMQRLAARVEKPVEVVVNDRRGGPPVASEQQEPTLTEEELNELFRENPAKAFQYVTDRNNKMLGAALESRLAPLGNSAVAAAEAEARRQWPLEFEIFKDEIERAKGRVDPSVFANPESWRQMISMVRGDNIMKFITETQKRAGVKSVEDQAREAQASGAGFVPRSREAPLPSGGSSQLDDLQRKVAEEFGMTPAEYIAFTKTGDQIG